MVIYLQDFAFVVPLAFAGGEGRDAQSSSHNTHVEVQGCTRQVAKVPGACDRKTFSLPALLHVEAAHV